MTRLFTRFLLLMSAAVLFGCAHPISLNTDLDAIKSASPQRIDKQVAYYLAEADRAREVITPGGGGDKVSYYPYRDLEPGLYKALSETFRGASKIADPKDGVALQSGGVSLLFMPQFTTNSFSDSVLTWPPTQFSIDLVCTVADAQGRPVKTLRVSGDGRATFSEFKGDFSLAAKRAARDLFDKLAQALATDPDLKR